MAEIEVIDESIQLRKKSLNLLHSFDTRVEFKYSKTFI